MLYLRGCVVGFVPSRALRLCCTFGHLPWLFMPHNIATHKSQFPRSYCHPTQPILQLRSHILLKIRLRLLYNHTHLLTYEQAPSERECDYMIDRIYLFFNKICSLACVCAYFFVPLRGILQSIC